MKSYSTIALLLANKVKSCERTTSIIHIRHQTYKELKAHTVNYGRQVNMSLIKLVMPSQMR